MPAEALIAQITDLHLQPDPTEPFRGFDLVARLDAVLDDIRTRFERLDLLLLTGDLTHHGNADTYAWLQAKVAGLADEVLWLPGNHDVSLHMGGSFWRRGLSLAGWRLILLDTTAEPDGRGSGSLAATELAALQQQLTLYPQPTLIAMHHNPLPTGSGWQDAVMLANPDAFWQQIDGHEQIQAVLHGHIHQQFDQCHAGVRVLATPAIAPQFKPQQDDFLLEDRDAFSGPAWRWLRLSDAGELSTGVVQL